LAVGIRKEGGPAPFRLEGGDARVDPQPQVDIPFSVCRGLPGVCDVRVKGAIGVVELESLGDVDALRARFVAEGVWVRPFGDVVYLMPPLVVEADELAALTRAVVRVLSRR